LRICGSPLVIAVIAAGLVRVAVAAAPPPATVIRERDRRRNGRRREEAAARWVRRIQVERVNVAEAAAGEGG
jgi:hypothetical protein